VSTVACGLASVGSLTLTAVGSLTLAALATVVLASSAAAATTATPELALAIVTGASQPRLLLAQRQVERTWGLSEDSVYREVDVPGWKSPGTAGALSAIVPGAGQAYAGSRRKAWVFAIVEAAAWTTHWFERRRGLDLQDDAAAYAGTPADSTSRWSFGRWERATNGDATRLRALYDRDRGAFFDEIGSDPSLLAGWSGDATATRQPFADLWDQGDEKRGVARWAAGAIWINHLVSAVDALNAARLDNVALGHSTHLGLKSGWSHGAPTFAATVERSF
jgi:hypothetical protein